MNINEELFRTGKVLYNTFDIDFDKPFSEQLDELNEDLIQVEFDKDNLLDIGWYSEHDENGKIVIQVIRDNQWQTSVIKEEAVTSETLLNSIAKMVTLINEMER